MQKRYPIDDFALKNGRLLEIPGQEKVVGLPHQAGGQTWDFALIAEQASTHPLPARPPAAEATVEAG